MIILKFRAIVILTPTFLGPSILVAILGGICGQICMTVRMPVKRVMSNAEAPILGHFGVTLTGLTSIRAFGAQERSSQDSDLVGYIHGYTRTARTFYDLNRWINVRIGILGALFSACLPAYLVYFHNLGAGDTGFSLNMAVAFNIELLWFIRDLMDLEYSATALSAYKTTWKLNKSQRSQGAAFLLPTGPSVVICMSKIFLRVTRATVLTYFATSTFKSNQESALTSVRDAFAFCRPVDIVLIVTARISWKNRGREELADPCASSMLAYDGLEMSWLNLDELRLKITIIPQIPELLSGTLRRNLNPFEQYDHAMLIQALRAVSMTSLQTATNAEGKITLDTFIFGAGDDVSIGQR